MLTAEAHNVLFFQILMTQALKIERGASYDVETLQKYITTNMRVLGISSKRRLKQPKKE